jgi:FixJ family two-component response regulator
VSFLRKPFVEQELVDTVTTALTAHTQKARDASRDAIATMLELVGYPETWADDLERRAFADGKLWRRTG